MDLQTRLNNLCLELGVLVMTADDIAGQIAAKKQAIQHVYAMLESEKAAKKAAEATPDK